MSSRVIGGFQFWGRVSSRQDRRVTLWLGSLFKCSSISKWAHSRQADKSDGERGDCWRVLETEIVHSRVGTPDADSSKTNRNRNANGKLEDQLSDSDAEQCVQYLKSSYFKMSFSYFSRL